MLGEGQYPLVNGITDRGRLNGPLGQGRFGHKSNYYRYLMALAST
ncbi:hypothetical protein Z945_3733 [Sulfitobacter noctilucae]|nr:hypothetical protein Z945_3733 [Sulfitobacter noctilucae]